MSQYTGTQIQLQVSTGSTPPFDANTGQTPVAYRAGAAVINVGVFDSSTDPVDLSNLSFLELVLQPAQDSSTILVTKTLPASNLTALITAGAWAQGLQQNATFNLTNADMDQSLGGLNAAQLWLTVIGITSTGGTIVYGSGPINLVANGATAPSLNGTVTLVSGAATISNAAILLTSSILLTRTAASGAASVPLATITVAGAATIAGLSTDNGTYNYHIFNL